MNGGVHEREPTWSSLEGRSMSTYTRVSHPIYNLFPTEIDGFNSPAELALDLRSSAA